MTDMNQDASNISPKDLTSLVQPSDEVKVRSGEIRKGDDSRTYESAERDGNLNLLLGVKLLVTVELGRANLSVKEVLELQKGSVVELDRIAGEAVDIYVNDSLIARGDVVVVDDKFGVRITELVPIEKSAI